MPGGRNGLQFHFGCLGFTDFTEFLWWYINEKIQLYSLRCSQSRIVDAFAVGSLRIQLKEILLRFIGMLYLYSKTGLLCFHYVI